jgi:hypothetical protein
MQTVWPDLKDSAKRQREREYFGVVDETILDAIRIFNMH